jgi:hypothetical protein
LLGGNQGLVHYVHLETSLDSAGILEHYSIQGLGNQRQYGCRTGLSGYIGWRNRFLGFLKV